MTSHKLTTRNECRTFSIKQCQPKKEQIYGKDDKYQFKHDSAVPSNHVSHTLHPSSLKANPSSCCCWVFFTLYKEYIVKCKQKHDKKNCRLRTKQSVKNHHIKIIYWSIAIQWISCFNIGDKRTGTFYTWFILIIS